MLSEVSDDRPQWKIDEIILDTLEGLDLSDDEAKAEFERIRILDEKQIEEELAKLEEAEDEDEDGGFDPFEYVASNPDLIAAFGTDEAAAERHWEEIGQAEGRATDEFDPLEYVASNPDLIAAFGGAGDPEEAATIHYIERGFAEGRTYEGGEDEEGPDEEGSDDGAPDGEGSEGELLAGEMPAGLASLEVEASRDFFL
jgi:hypothetical protein